MPLKSLLDESEGTLIAATRNGIAVTPTAPKSYLHTWTETCIMHAVVRSTVPAKVAQYEAQYEHVDMVTQYKHVYMVAQHTLRDTAHTPDQQRTY